MRLTTVLLPLFAASMLITGCAKKEEPATQALVASEASLSQLRPDAAKYAPEALAKTEAQLAALKNSMSKENYKAVLAGTPKFNESLVALNDAVVARKTQIAAATNEWTDLSTDVPKLVSAIQNRVDILSQSRKLPSDVNKESFDAAKAALVWMKSAFAEARAAFDAGNATEAADKARLVQAKGEEVRKQLGMTDA